MNPTINLLGLVTPQPFKLLLLWNSQRLSLKFERDIADFIQEERAFICQLEAVDFTGDCADECSLFVAEEFTLQQAERNRCAVEPHEMAVAPWTEVVNRASDQFFAGSCGNSNPQSSPQTFWWRVRYSRRVCVIRLRASNAFILQDPDEHATILGLTLGSCVRSYLRARAHRTRGKHIRQGNIALLF
jgi:hypothetical protein